MEAVEAVSACTRETTGQIDMKRETPRKNYNGCQTQVREKHKIFIIHNVRFDLQYTSSVAVLDRLPLLPISSVRSLSCLYPSCIFRSIWLKSVNKGKQWSVVEDKGIVICCRGQGNSDLLWRTNKKIYLIRTDHVTCCKFLPMLVNRSDRISDHSVMTNVW